MINGITNETFDVKTNNGARLRSGFQVFHLERKKGDCFRLTEIDQRVTNKAMRGIREAFKQYRGKKIKRLLDKRRFALAPRVFLFFCGFGL